jgi:hypothetical protein
MNRDERRDDKASIAGWSPARRRIVSALIIFHLAAVVYAPLTLDGAYAALFRPLSFLRVYATALYLDHGYRFFAPDPGPTHTIRFEHGADGQPPQSQRLPDAQKTRPRLLYHRWFMLGESLAAEVGNSLVAYADYAESQRQLSSEIAELAQQGRVREVQQLQSIFDANQREFERRWQLTLVLTQALRQHLEAQYPGETIRIYSRRQLIPRPQDIRIGKAGTLAEYVEEVDLSDPQATLNALKPEEVPVPKDSIQ